jgi:aldose 1-epimerase
VIEKKLFGKLPDGKEVHQYTLTNSSGSKVTIISYGAIITSIIVPNRNGKFEDVVLGYDTLQGYINDKTFLGSIVGRYGNRIGKGQFQLEGKTYQLATNNGENHLHGGIVGYNKKLWDAEAIEGHEPALTLTLVSPDGEEGYPGTVTLVVTYTLTNKNELRVDYKGTTDKTTILNPTQHSYFNLSGTLSQTILDHRISIEADSFTIVDKGQIPTGQIMSVANTPLDFRTIKAIGAHIDEKYEQLQIGRGYDNNWVLRNFDGKVRKVAEVEEPHSGRVMIVHTDQPGIQFYSGNSLGETKGKNGVTYKRRTGFCLEAQGYPDSPNKPEFPSVVLKPGDIYKQTTIYQFLTRK